MFLKHINVKVGLLSKGNIQVFSVVAGALRGRKVLRILSRQEQAIQLEQYICPNSPYIDPEKTTNYQALHQLLPFLLGFLSLKGQHPR